MQNRYMSVSFFEKKRDCKYLGILLAFDRHYLGIVDIIWTLRYSVTMEEGHSRPERTKALLQRKRLHLYEYPYIYDGPQDRDGSSLRTNTQSLTIAARRRDQIFRKKFPGGKIQFETKDLPVIP